MTYIYAPWLHWLSRSFCWPAQRYVSSKFATFHKLSCLFFRLINNLPQSYKHEKNCRHKHTSDWKGNPASFFFFVRAFDLLIAVRDFLQIKQKSLSKKWPILALNSQVKSNIVTGLCATFLLFSGTFVNMTHQKKKQQHKGKLVYWQWGKSESPIFSGFSHDSKTCIYISKRIQL